MSKRYYIAYGSNINQEQMAFRCPDAAVEGVSKIPGYELVFRGHTDRAVATIEPCENSSVPVVVWRISRSDEKSLDIYEGFPRLYEKQMFKVMLGGKHISAMAYVMTPGRLHGKASRDYINIISEGYSDFGFDTNKLLEAAHRSEQLCFGTGEQHTKASEILNLHAEHQKEQYIAVCPRCGKSTMKNPLYYNSLSRRHRIYVCNNCGMNEAVHDFAGHDDPITQWYVVRLVASCNIPK